MKRSRSMACLIGACAISCCLEAQAAGSNTSTTSNVWQYTLLPNSTLTEECPICGRPTFEIPLRGTFNLRLLETNKGVSTYAWEAVAWSNNKTDLTTYRLTGQGTYQCGGNAILTQAVSLALNIDNGVTNKLCYFTNSFLSLTNARPWPELEIGLEQTNGTMTQVYHLQVMAAPLRELWFSTRNGFHAQIWNSPTNYVSPGSLISLSGRIIKANSDLISQFVFMPPVPDLGLDAVDLLPGGEVAFSIEQNIFSPSAGFLHNGDVLSDKGRVLTNYGALIGAFGPEPPVADQGLDALQFMTNGEIYFSITNDFWSETLGKTIRKGDLLSSRGVVVKRNEELVGLFRPADITKDYGLDAIYVWPNGEIWFSVEMGFNDAHFDSFMAGDILSDRGYVVARNLDLVAAFQPMEDLSDFGLDALVVVTDLTPPVPDTSPLKCDPLAIDPSGAITLDWNGLGRAFQVEKTANIMGPWLPFSPIVTAPPIVDQALTNGRAFYRLRQW